MIEQRSVSSGAIAYFLRVIFTMGLGFVANLFLLRLFKPIDFGTIAVLNIAVGLVNILTEGGLNIYLIQTAENITPRVFANYLNGQLLIWVCTHIAVSLLLLVQFVTNRSIPHLALYLWCALFAVPFALYRGGPFVQLERNLDFKKIAIIESSESAVYSGTSIICALFGFGVWSIVVALLLRAVVGCLLARKLSPVAYLRGVGFQLEPLKKGFKFGLHYHLPSALSQLRAAANPIIIGNAVGLAAVGICDRSAFVAGLPLTIISAVQSRVFFPYFAKVQGDKAAVTAIFNRTLYFSALLDKLFFIPVLLHAGQPLVALLGAKWASAPPLIRIMLIGNMLFGAFVSSLVPLLNGLGRSQLLARMAVASTACLWLLLWPLTLVVGINSFAYLGLLNWLICLIIYKPLIRLLPNIQIWRPMFGTAAAAGFACGAAVLTIRPVCASLSLLVLIGLRILVALLLYCAILMLYDREKIKMESLALFRRLVWAKT
jgi:O-antigen/teichoic acid export membrane protein